MDQDQKSQPSSEGEQRVFIEYIDDPEEEVEPCVRQPEYNVENIRDAKIMDGKKHYLVKWEGYPDSENTWEPAENLNSIITMVQQFEKELLEKNSSQMQIEDIKPVDKALKVKTKLKKTQNTKNLRQKPDLKEEIVVKKKKKISNEEKMMIEEEENEINSKKDTSDTTKTYKDESKAKEKKVSDLKKQDNVEITQVQPNKENKVKADINKDLGQKRIYQDKKKDKMGSFRLKDKPKAILGIKPGKNNEFHFFVEWENRTDGFKPENAAVSNEEFRQHNPNFLLDFYESKIVIFSRKFAEEKKKSNINQENLLFGSVDNVKNKENIMNYDTKENKDSQQEIKIPKRPPFSSQNIQSKDNNNQEPSLEEIARKMDLQSIGQSKEVK